MKIRYSIAVATMGAALAFGGPALAAAGTTTGQEQGATFSSWMNDYSTNHNGRISRQAYLDEAGRRWDMTDTTRQGLTVDEVNRMYDMKTGQVPVSGLAPGSKPLQK